MLKHRIIKCYSTGIKLLHWLIACIVISMLALSFFMNDLAQNAQPQAYMIHKSFGLTVFALMLMRIVWIIHTGKPPLPKTVPAWEKLLSRMVQWSFYVLLLAMPICGWMTSVASNKMTMYFGLFQVPTLGIAPDKTLAHFMDQSHKTIAWVLIALIVLHVAGALKHYVSDKDTVMQRMWGK